MITCDIVIQNIMKKRKEILYIRKNFDILRGQFKETLWQNIYFKYLFDILNFAKRGHPRFFSCCYVTLGASHAMFIVTCGETSDPHPRGVNITRPCRALSLRLPSTAAQCHLKHSTIPTEYLQIHLLTHCTQCNSVVLM